MTSIWILKRRTVNTCAKEFKKIELERQSLSKYTSLLKVINNTKTPMGRRMLEDRLKNPILDKYDKEDIKKINVPKNLSHLNHLKILQFHL